jgi:hypothetical protein
VVRRILSAGIAVAFVFACGEIREDEMECEEAVARLADCCSNVETNRFVCIKTHGCGGATLTPDFTADGSECIRKKSCEEIGPSCAALRDLSNVPRTSARNPQFDIEACR